MIVICISGNRLRIQRFAKALAKTIAGIVITLWLACAIADDANAIDAIRSIGTLRVGTTGDYKPFSYRNASGRYVGLDIEMAESLAQSLGVKLELVATTWPTLMQDLAAKHFDIAMGGISITPERQRQALFSVPYLHDGKTVIARCEQQSRFETLSQIDRADVRLIVNPGGTNERFVRGHIVQAAITVYPDNVTIFDQLVAGKADVMITDAVEARLQQRLHPQLCALHPDAPFEVTEKAYLLPRDTALKAFVDDWLAQKIKRGEFNAAFERWLDYPWNGANATNGAVASSPEVATLLALMRERLQIGVDVARSKWNSGSSIEDSKRESEVIAGLTRQAGELGLPLPWAEHFFRDQIEASKIVQRELHARWRRQGQGRFDDAPDLARDIRPRLDALTPRLLAALAGVWADLCDPTRHEAELDVAFRAIADDPLPADVGQTAMAKARSGLQATPECASR